MCCLRMHDKRDQRPNGPTSKFATTSGVALLPAVVVFGEIEAAQPGVSQTLSRWELLPDQAGMRRSDACMCIAHRLGSGILPAIRLAVAANPRVISGLPLIRQLRIFVRVAAARK